MTNAASMVKHQGTRVMGPREPATNNTWDSCVMMGVGVTVYVIFLELKLVLVTRMTAH